MPCGSATGMREKIESAVADTAPAKKPGSARRMPQGSALGIERADFFTNKKHIRESSLFLLAIACVSFSLGASRMHSLVIAPSPLVQYEGNEVTLVAKVMREPEVRETTLHLYVSPIGDVMMDDVVVLITTDQYTGQAMDLAYGDTVHARGILEVPEPFATDMGRVFDYPGYLRARGVTHMISLAEVQVEQKDTGSFLGYIFAGKYAFMQVIERIIPEPQAGLGEGILLGVKRAIGEELEKTFRETGIIHIVVLSGYNIMLVVNFCMTILSYLFFPRTRMFFGLGVIVLFALLVGLSATVVRASIMASLIIVAQSTGRTYAVLRALLLAGVVMLIINPYLLVHDPGFQLSFLATLGLVLLIAPIERRLTVIPERWGLRTIVSATIATQVFVLPLLLYQMGMFSVVSIVVNTLVLPMVPVAMLLTFATGVVGLVSVTLGYLSGYLAYLSLEYIVVVATLFGALPFASFTVGMFPFWVVVLVYSVYAVGITYFIRHDARVKEMILPKVTSQDKSDVVNDYAGWTIVEEKRESPETQSVSKDPASRLPFR